MHQEFIKIENDYQTLLGTGVQKYLTNVMSNLLEKHEQTDIYLAPVIGYDFTQGTPILLTVAAVGCAKMQNVSIPLTIALWPVAEFSSGMLNWAERMEVDAEEIVSTLLSRKLAIIALEEDVEYAKEFGWTKVLLEVSAQKRKTNFEQATDVQEAFVSLKDLADQVPKEYKDLFSAILDQYNEMDSPEIIFTMDEEFDGDFQNDWL